MATRARNLRALSWGLICACLSGCATTSYYFEDIETHYQQVQLPNAFSDGKPGWTLSGYAAWNGQKPIRFSEDTSFSVVDLDGDTTWTPVHGDFRYDRAPNLVGGSAFYSTGEGFFGLTGGLSSAGENGAHFGFFGGASWRSGRWHPLIEAGFLFNRVSSTSVFWEKSRLAFLEGSRRDTASKEILDFVWPVKLGMSVDLGPVSPYVFLSRSGTRTWPINLDEARNRLIYQRDIALGTVLRGPAGAGLEVEGAREWVEVGDYYGASHWCGRAALRVDFR